MTEERTQNPDDEQMPGSVSNQNGEEQLPEHEGQGTTRRPPGTTGDDDQSGGEASEGSQSTGHPSSAG